VVERFLASRDDASLSEELFAEPEADQMVATPRRPDRGFSSLTLALLLFLMSGTSGLFSHRITVVSFFDNASGLRVGAPVRLNGVDIGNVVGMRIVPDKDKQLTRSK